MQILDKKCPKEKGNEGRKILLVFRVLRKTLCVKATDHESLNKLDAV